VKNNWDRYGDVPWIPPAFADENGLVGVGGTLDPPCLLRAYAEGVFPWFSDGDPILWWSPDPRAVFDIKSGLHISRRLARTLRSGKFAVTFNRAFGEVIRACGDRPEGTWITREMVTAYEQLHRLRFAHSVEAWQDGELAGGVYGVALNGFFAAESMFFRRTDGSKIALVALFERLQERGFELVDTQMLTEHTERMGAFEVSRERYLELLKRAIGRRGVRFD
jgi:leucyl/phenylalanyl-tRNA--protein transferase